MPLNHRASVILKDNSAVPAWGAAYQVVVTPVGAVAASTSSGTTITVDAPHSFIANDKILVYKSSSSQLYSGTDDVQSLTATTIVMGSSYDVTAGDLIVNLGPDTGGASGANYDGSPMGIYSDPDGGTAITSAKVTCDEFGNYGYYLYGDGACWELILDSLSSPAGVITGWGGRSKYNVQDFGAVGDGSTDDRARINSAVVAAEKIAEDKADYPIAGGPPVFFPDPPIYYNIDSEITLDSQYAASLEGESMKTEIRLGTTATNVIHVSESASAATRVNNNHIRNLLINGDRNATNAIFVESCKRMQIENVFLYRFLTAGLKLGGANEYGCSTDTSNLRIDGDIGVAGASRPDYGIDIVSGAADSFFSDITISYIKTSGVRSAQGNNYFTNVHIFGGTGYPAYGFECNGGLSIDQCYLDGIATAGVYVNANTCLVSNNNFFWPAPGEAGAKAIDVVAGKNNHVFIGNKGSNMNAGVDLVTFADTADLHASVSIGNQPNQQQTDLQPNILEGGLLLNRLGGSLDAYLDIGADAGQTGRVRYISDDGERRWTVGKDATAEAGSEVGSDYVITRYDDDGANPVDNLKLFRSDGRLRHTGATSHGAATAFADQDATPSIALNKVFKTANTVGTTITDFDDAQTGSEIFVLIDDANTTIDLSGNANMVGNGGLDVTTQNSALHCWHEGGVWHVFVTEPS